MAKSVAAQLRRLPNDHWRRQAYRLVLGIRHLERVVLPHLVAGTNGGFDMGDWAHKEMVLDERDASKTVCKTQMCAAGHMACDPQLRAAGLTLDWGMPESRLKRLETKLAKKGEDALSDDERDDLMGASAAIRVSNRSLKAVQGSPLGKDSGDDLGVFFGLDAEQMDAAFYGENVRRQDGSINGPATLKQQVRVLKKALKQNFGVVLP